MSRKLKPLEHDAVQVPPIDLLYLAAVAEKSTTTVKVIDFLLDRLEGAAAERFCLHHIPRRDRSVWVGVRLSMPSFVQDLAFANRLKDLLGDCTVFVFGAVIKQTLDHWVDEAWVDYILYGEPEAFIGQAMAAADPREVDGVVDPRRYTPLRGADLFDERKVMERSNRWRSLADLRKLPRPAWHLLDLHRYVRAGASEAELGVHVQASRGCPLACTMCPYMLLEGTVWRSNDVERVVDEIAYLNEAFGIHRVRFRDANFGFQRKYARALAESILARGVKLSATIEASVEVFDDETLALLRRAGVNTLTTGVETNDAACMESLGQKIRINDKLRDRIGKCHDLGFRVYGTFCLGAPEETWDTVERTWRFALELDVESGFTVMTPFPGTPMYWRALRERLLDPGMRFSEWNSYSATMRTYALSTTDLDMARWWARMETILPYRRKRAAGGGAAHMVRFYVAHAPHYAWRTVCRAYVGARRRMPAHALTRMAGTVSKTDR